MLLRLKYYFEVLFFMMFGFIDLLDDFLLDERFDNGRLIFKSFIL